MKKEYIQPCIAVVNVSMEGFMQDCLSSWQVNGNGEASAGGGKVLETNPESGGDFLPAKERRSLWD